MLTPSFSVSGFYGESDVPGILGLQILGHVSRQVPENYFSKK